MVKVYFDLISASKGDEVAPDKIEVEL